MVLLSQSAASAKQTLQRPIRRRARPALRLIASLFLLASLVGIRLSHGMGASSRLALLVLALQVAAGLLLARKTGWIALAGLLAAPLFARCPGEALLADGCLFYGAVMLSMLIAFARTLSPGMEPLVTALARQVHGTLRRDVAFYTRRLTQIWTAFFALSLIVPAALAALGPAGAWHVPLDGGTACAAAVLMVAELGVRRMVIRNFDHVSLKDAITAYRGAFARPTPPSA